MNFKDILKSQQSFFDTNITKEIPFRKKQLLKLKTVIEQNEQSLYKAIEQDFGKSEFDTYTTEISIILNDIDYYLKHIDEFSKPKTVSTNMVNQVAFSYVYPEPLGCTLVLGAWNYPYQLTLSPMIAAMAAGNTIIVKPSEVAENTMFAIQKLINDTFDSSYIYCAVGGVDTVTNILKLNFNKIFFTGSTKVGKIVYEAAAKNLTPVTLELGGKSPTIVTKHANLNIAAKRIVWGKFLNAGQTCVAPDYILVEESVEKKLISLIIKFIEKYNYQPNSKHYTRIINHKNFDRLIDLIKGEKIIYGGNYNRVKLHIEPTLLTDISWNDSVMQEEIFGPILPIMTFTNYEEALAEIKAQPKPLAAYLFSNSPNEKEYFCKNISFGGGCINDTVMHLINEDAPFGGVGNSGIGNYHGKYGFDTFSHQKSILRRATWGEPNLKFPPYSDFKLSIIKKIIRKLLN